jgi:3-phosphoshikimate 1-carboxyvinyltransferase
VDARAESPTGRLIGETSVPGDKSTTQRALLLGAVAGGTTVARSALRADDTLATASIVAALGAQVAWDAGDDALVVRGAETLASPEERLDCRNAGTAARLLLGLLAGREGRWRIDGDASLRRRPMGRVIAPLAAMGASIRGESLPLLVEGAALHGARLVVDVPSAQVKSALLLAGLCADEPTTVVQYVPTRDHTERMLPRFGIRLDSQPGEVTVHPGRPRGTELVVPGDPSSAAFLVVAALLAPGSDLILRDVGLWPRRVGFLDVLEHAGADVMVTRRAWDDTTTGAAPRPLGETANTLPVPPGHRQASDPRGDLRAGGSELSAFEISPEQVPDLVDEVPILALAAARARGTSRFAGLSELRVKESDRVTGTAELLAALGVPVEVGDDTLTITGVDAFTRPGRPLDFDDHRLALTAAVACLVSGWPLPPLSAAEVSFPGFADLVARLRSAGEA